MVDDVPIANPSAAGSTGFGGFLIRIFSIEGRVAVSRWIVWFAVGAAAAMIWFLVLREARGVAYVAAWTVMGLVFAKLVTESIRRIHDRGQSGGRFAVIVAIVIALLIASLFWRMSHGTDLVALLLEAAAVIVVAVSFLWPGARERNRHGPPPATLASSGGGGGRGGAVLAGIVLTTFIGGGLAFSTWLDAGESARVEQLRIGEAVHRDLDRREREGRALRSDVEPDGEGRSTSNRLDELLDNGATL